MSDKEQELEPIGTEPAVIIDDILDLRKPLPAGEKKKKKRGQGYTRNGIAQARKKKIMRKRMRK